MHLDDGQLRAHLDGQLHESGLRHLEACAACRERLARLSDRARTAGHALARLAPSNADPRLRPQPAWTRLKSRFEPHNNRKESVVFNHVLAKRNRSAWVLASAAVVLLVSFTFAPVRAWAGQFLGLFRVQQVTVLPVELSNFSQPGDEDMVEQLGQLIADSVRVTREPGEPRSVADAAEASAAAGFQVRLPGNRADSPNIKVLSGAAFEFTVDLERVEAMIDEAGLAGPDLPASLDGALIIVDIPAGLSAQYGECPGEDRNPWQSEWNACMVVAQVPSPTVTTPPDLDVAALAEIGLQFAGMTPEEARAFSQTVDWTSTLVVPVPRNAASSEPVTVDGTTGYLMIREGNDGRPGRYALLWVKGEVVYSIAGFNDPAEAVEAANSLR